jgi:hypothetical protein
VGSVATFQSVTPVAPVASGVGDATKHATAIKAAVARRLANRVVDVFIKREPLWCLPTFALSTHTTHDGLPTAILCHSDSSPTRVPAAIMPSSACGTVASVTVVGGRSMPGTKKAAIVAATAESVNSAKPWV